MTDLGEEGDGGEAGGGEVAERWSGGAVERRSGEEVKWWSGGAVEWWSGGEAERDGAKGGGMSFLLKESGRDGRPLFGLGG